MIHDFNEPDVSGVAFIWNWLRKIVFLLGMVSCVVGAFTSFSSLEERTLIPILVNIVVILASLGSAALAILKKPRVYRSLLLATLAVCAGLLYWKEAMASFIFQVTGIALAWIGHMGILGIFSILGAILAFVFSRGSSSSSGSESSSERRTSGTPAKKEKFYCEYCGQRFDSVAELRSRPCFMDPDGSKKHKLYEGSEKTKYTCKYCGQNFTSIMEMTRRPCFKRPDGDGPHTPAL